MHFSSSLRKFYSAELSFKTASKAFLQGRVTEHYILGKRTKLYKLSIHIHALSQSSSASLPIRIFSANISSYSHYVFSALDQTDAGVITFEVCHHHHHHDHHRHHQDHQHHHHYNIIIIMEIISIPSIDIIIIITIIASTIIFILV